MFPQSTQFENLASLHPAIVCHFDKVHLQLQNDNYCRFDPQQIVLDICTEPGILVVCDDQGTDICRYPGYVANIWCLTSGATGILRIFGQILLASLFGILSPRLAAASSPITFPHLGGRGDVADVPNGQKLK